MKHLVLLTCLVLLFASNSFANKHEDNFKTCAASDESWMRRWGQYVVSYDLYQAYDICRKKAWPDGRNINAKPTGCYIDGSFLVAGYYCDQ